MSSFDIESIEPSSKMSSLWWLVVVDEGLKLVDAFMANKSKFGPIRLREEMAKQLILLKKWLTL